MPQRMRIRMPSPAMVVALLALIVALSGVAYAATMLPRNSVGTRQLKRSAVTRPKLAHGSVDGAKIVPMALTLADLGAAAKRDRVGGTRTVTAPITLAPHLCVADGISLFNPPVGPSGASVLGALVIGTLTDANGHAAVDNEVAVAPSMMIETSQGGAIVNLVVCNANNNPETIPAGSVFHYRLIYAR